MAHPEGTKPWNTDIRTDLKDAFDDICPRRGYKRGRQCAVQFFLGMDRDAQQKMAHSLDKPGAAAPESHEETMEEKMTRIAETVAKSVSEETVREALARLPAEPAAGQAGKKRQKRGG